MVLITSNKVKQLLYICHIGQVRLSEFPPGQEDLKMQLDELSAGFTLLADFSRLETMDLDCAPELGRVMERIGRAGVGLVIRVIPDPRKDIGMNILTVFHYPHHPRVVTCETMVAAARALAAAGDPGPV